ncbi:MAG: class I SAM-dependent methyltransferase [Polyangiaceae bacterium]
MIPRTLEPEDMDTEEESRDYDQFDFTEVNEAFCDDLLALTGSLDGKQVLDMGCGTARIPIALVRKSGVATVTAVDLSAQMLVIAGENVRAARLESRIVLELKDARHAGWPDRAFDAVMSNSIIHHIKDPTDAIGEMARLTKPGGLLFVRDLCRPSSEEEVERILQMYAGDPAKLDDAGKRRYPRQRELFGASLRASLTFDELKAITRAVGIPSASVAMTSDRHWTIAWKK